MILIVLFTANHTFIIICLNVTADQRYSEACVVNKGPLSHGDSSMVFPAACAALRDALIVPTAPLMKPLPPGTAAAFIHR